MDNPSLKHALAAAQVAHLQVAAAQDHHDEKVHRFIASSALMMRAARREPEEYQAEQKRLGIKPRKNLREEMIAIRVGSKDPRLQQPHWANAAAYLAEPPNGDEPPVTVEAAVTYMKKRGGMKDLSALWSGRLNGEEQKKEDINAVIEALLTGLQPDFQADPWAGDDELPGRGEDFEVGGWVLALVQVDRVGRGYMLYGTDAQLASLAKRIRKRSVLLEGINEYVSRRRAEMAEDSEDAKSESPMDIDMAAD